MPSMLDWTRWPWESIHNLRSSVIEETLKRFAFNRELTFKICVLCSVFAVVLVATKTFNCCTSASYSDNFFLDHITRIAFLFRIACSTRPLVTNYKYKNSFNFCWQRCIATNAFIFGCVMLAVTICSAASTLICIYFWKHRPLHLIPERCGPYITSLTIIANPTIKLFSDHKTRMITKHAPMAPQLSCILRLLTPLNRVDS